ncbi:LytR/AlgR family response regulator transcription factor [Spirosoma rhododendri]|uniref:Response regulator transcription factor n=1 Tax=Spirosoma rhododendri TaxID=2728024 RepID=A0A7L5DLJ1_9BACT|nr:LytTR family DNA-binding domain-containing protein [Spirosoma rhododendri]QJD77308.1 response regulator transcription factor [Spirosoma rhododendri]
MITAIALDDERPALDVIEAFCDRIDTIDLVKTFTRTGEARQFLAENPVDLVFLDINMPNESGLSFSRLIPPPTLVIFTTAYSEFAAESYEVEAIDYLLKPFSFERFQKSVERVQTRRQGLQQASGGDTDMPEPTHLYFRVDYGLVKITVADIRYIEGLDNYLKIHLIAGKPVVVRLTMKAMLDKLPAGQFVRVHRSFIVAFDKIQGVRNKLILMDDVELPVGSSYETEFFGRFGR